MQRCSDWNNSEIFRQHPRPCDTLVQVIAIRYIYNSEPMRATLDSNMSLHPCKPELLADPWLQRKRLRYLGQFEADHGTGFKDYQTERARFRSIDRSGRKRAKSVTACHHALKASHKRPQTTRRFFATICAAITFNTLRSKGTHQQMRSSRLQTICSPRDQN